MDINATVQLSRVLEELDFDIKRLERSPNRMFLLIEHYTLRLFHYFNLHFNKFWDVFDYSSASQLIQYMEIVRTYSELSNRYVSLIREQLDYLEGRIDFETENVKKESPLLFPEDNATGIIDYYQEYFKTAIAAEGRPLHKIFFDNETQSDFIDVENIPKDFFVFCSYQINDSHYKGLYGMYSSLNRLYFLFGIFSSYIDKLLSGYKPSIEDIIRALEKESRQYAKEIGKNVEHDLKITAQYKKSSRNDRLTPDVWGRVMDEEDDLYRLAISGQLEENKEKRFENIFEDQRKQYTNNASLLQKIKNTAIDGELFDIKLSIETHNLLTSLNADNLDLFYELILRRNIIQREMFPEKLKSKYEEWANPSEDNQRGDIDDTELSSARISKLNGIINILKKGNWKAPASSENIEMLMNTVFGRDLSSIEEGDETLCKKMWALVEKGRGDRMKIVPANLAGFFLEEDLLAGSPKEISNDLFGDDGQINNINKGNSNYSSSDSFSDVVPFLKKYTNKIIRKV